MPSLWDMPDVHDRSMKPPWWFCNGWWSPWCVLDTIAHWLGLPLDGDYWICRKHDDSVERKL